MRNLLTPDELEELTGATEAKRQGLDAQALLNHTDASTTRIYLRGREIEVVHGPRIQRSA